MVPRLVVKVIAVPLCGGVPPASITCAMMSVVPFTGRAVAEAVIVMLEPLGASNGTFSHATLNHAGTTSRAARANFRRNRDIMKTINILIPMDLAGQAERGYAMAALLVALSIMAIMMTVVMPVWKQTAQREKEEELIFRGKQYVHAIGLFQRKYANTPPPNLDVLVEQRFLRKKFKDPITNDDFVPIAVGQTAPGTGQQGGRGAAGSQTAAGGRGQTQPQGSTQPGIGGVAGGPPVSTQSPGQTSGGISGVASKSKDQSIRLYNGRGHYNEWAFVYIQQQQAPGAAPGAGNPGRGQPGQQPGPLGPGGRPTGPGGRGFGPNGPGRGGGPGRSTGGVGTFNGGGVSPIQPPTRGRE